jgi:radical SAM protein with 4Fe4S-binding SPASM domain
MQKLLDHKVNVCISLPTFDEQLYHTVYGVDRAKQVAANVAEFLKMNSFYGFPCRIVLRFRNPEKPSAVINSEFFKEHIQPYLSDRVTCNFTIDFDNWAGTIKDVDMFGEMKLRAVPLQVKVPCAGLTGFITLYDGSVRMCGCRFRTTEKDELVVGNIKDNTLEEIAQSPAVHRIYEKFYSGERPDVCRECSFYNPMTKRLFKELTRE